MVLATLRTWRKTGSLEHRSEATWTSSLTDTHVHGDGGNSGRHRVVRGKLGYGSSKRDVRSNHAEVENVSEVQKVAKGL